MIDRTETRAGIRSLTFDPNKGFALNGKFLKVKGVCIHHDAGCLGAAVPKEVWRRRLLQLKEIGCNAVRMSHNPQATCVYELCDELGILVKVRLLMNGNMLKRNGLPDGIKENRAFKDRLLIFGNGVKGIWRI